MVSSATGNPTSHHVTYELGLFDGRIPRTRISHPVNRTTYGASIWSHILRDQLGVTADEFWGCVQAGELPDRGGPPEKRDAIPSNLVFTLIKQVGLSPDEVGAMSRAEAIDRVNEFWTTGQ